MLTFLINTFSLNKISALIHFILVILIIISLVIGYFVWDKSVKNSVVAEYNQAELQQIIANQKDVLIQQKEISNLILEASKNMEMKKVELDTKTSAVSTYLNTPPAQSQNRKTSSVITDTFRKLNENISK